MFDLLMFGVNQRQTFMLNGHQHQTSIIKPQTL